MKLDNIKGNVENWIKLKERKQNEFKDIAKTQVRGSKKPSKDGNS